MRMPSLQEATWERMIGAVEKVRERCARAVRALEAAGHWGVPTSVFAGEPFFGQDRLELLLWRLRQHGLRHRMSE